MGKDTDSQSDERSDYGLTRRTYLGAVGMSAGLFSQNASGHDNGRHRGHHRDLRVDTLSAETLTGGVTEGADLTNIAGNGLSIEDGSLELQMPHNAPTEGIVEYHDIDDYGADPSGEEPSDEAFDAAVDNAEEYDWLVMTNGTYLFEELHTIEKSMTVFARGSTIKCEVDGGDTSLAVVRFKGKGYDELGVYTHLAEDIHDGKRVLKVSPDTDFSEFYPGREVVVANAIQNPENTNTKYYAGRKPDKVRKEGEPFYWGDREYIPSVSRIRRVDASKNKIYLESPVRFDYYDGNGDEKNYNGEPRKSGDVVYAVDALDSPRVVGGNWTGTMSSEKELPTRKNVPSMAVTFRETVDAVAKDVHVDSYLNHAFQAMNTWRTSFIDCSTGMPPSYGSGEGETFRLAGNTEVYLVRPKIMSCRRGIDIRSGTKTAHVIQPYITGVVLKGISFHGAVRGEFNITGGLVQCGGEDFDKEVIYQSSNVFSANPLEQSRIDAEGMTFLVSSNVFGGNHVRDVHLRNCRIHAYVDYDHDSDGNDGDGQIADILDLDETEDSTFEGMYIGGNGLKTRAVNFGKKKPTKNVTFQGEVRGTFGEEALRVGDDTENVSIDVEIVGEGDSPGARGLRVDDVGNVSISGSVTGNWSDEAVRVGNGASGLDLDLAIDSSSSGIVLGDSEGVSIHDSRVSAGSGPAFDASGSVENLRVVDSDFTRGSNGTVSIDGADGLWVKNDAASSIDVGASTNTFVKDNLIR